MADRRVVRLIQKWLNAGVLEDGEWTRERGRDAAGRRRHRRCWRTSTCTTCSTSGSSNGERRHARGDVVIVRFADDFVVGFEHRDDAERFLARAARATREVRVWSCIPTRRGSSSSAGTRARRRAAAAAASRRRSTSSASRTSAGSRGGTVPAAAADRAEANAGEAARAQERLQRRVISPCRSKGDGSAASSAGTSAYFAVPPTAQSGSFRTQVIRHWRRGASARSQRDRLNWRADERLADRWLPLAAIQHPGLNSALTLAPEVRAQCGSAARLGSVRGAARTHREGSSLPRPRRCRRRQAWNRLGDTRRNRKIRGDGN